MKSEINRNKINGFLLQELISRDFKQKYKRTVFGMAWSIMSPLLNLLVISLVMKRFFAHNISHYTIYIFCGILVMSFFRESTIGGMNSLVFNKNIITKINIPKYLFLISKNVSSLINFLITLIVFVIFCIFDGIHLNFNFFMLFFPIIFLTLFSIGVGLILSALFVFFKDISYIYDIFLVLLNYLSAIFYSVESFPTNVQRIFLLNPIYVYIHYFRCIVIDGNIPSIQFHVLCIFYALASLAVGSLFYKKFNHRFLYYM